MAESTNPLDTLKIKKLIGFKHITPGVITGNVISALKYCGIDAVTSVNVGASEFSIGSMSFLGNTFYGLKVATNKGGNYHGSLSLTLTSTSNLENKALQVGFRLTATAYSSHTTTQLFDFFAGISLGANAPVTSEDTSAYYEAVLSVEKTSPSTKNTVLRVYVNKQLIATSKAGFYQDKSVVLRSLNNSLSTGTGADFSCMIGDIYVAELDYNSDGTVTPQLLGNITLEPFTVATYSGDKHINSLGNDIVTAINTLDPNNDMGVLEIKPVMQAATFTFNPPDITNGTIMGASVNIVYKDSAAPNNRLRYRISEGTQNLPVEVITERQADVTGYSTFTRIMTTPEGGGAWNADNTRFALKLFNSETPEEE
ncbi:hypothetical protein CRQ31_19310 [Salmonella enterica subsp. enterica serovar Worthington]|uniref:Uncharacterized protein n=1 Tax=Salmonella enterica subsp. enterica serovar Ank TaxID=1173578 RepID=A0A726XZU3_SALET|nr:hypothetical protein [Salmonella enterica subsp. enterica serovar Denver]ECD5428889.1 hypothetical protein [Salmonella enterica subsp. enterica serovar Denver]EGI5054396.1 hypothetical protein [Salmonella enterica subsp. enterica serovar Worthington]HAE1794539.1 hypothetical protein [Salmonella enterica subsp. enterica serovar Ank]HCM3792595.1 hypothetical protein [Salmonella enterica subsp. enterica serovar Denver]